jgi:DNA-directed RNA polymerase subunit RPC12/RpoP
MALEYITTRILANSKGEEKGKVRIIKMAEDTFATVELTCPECGFTESRKENWSVPFTEGEGKNQKFNIRCSKCGFSVKLMKLKKEVKKKQKG